MLMSRVFFLESPNRFSLLNTRRASTRCRGTHAPVIARICGEHPIASPWLGRLSCSGAGSKRAGGTPWQAATMIRPKAMG